GQSDIILPVTTTTTTHTEKQQKPADETEDFADSALSLRHGVFDESSRNDIYTPRGFRSDDVVSLRPGTTCHRYITSNENVKQHVLDEDLLPAPDYLPRFDVIITAKPHESSGSNTRDDTVYRCDSENVYTDSSVHSERRNYEDYLVSPRNRRGWTTITETTTITYARSVSIERSVRGRRQRYFENVEVH
uniref:Uncharacterized protein n=1 Tax=Panagrolaimus sp. ES5 TaxID=591445 RepID=A0AC34GKR3_9BILA